MFVQQLTVGDSMGCGVNNDGNSKKVYFTRNGSTVTLNAIQLVTLVCQTNFNQVKKL